MIKRKTSQGETITSLCDWLAEVHKLWSDDKVSSGHSNVQISKLSLSATRVKKTKRRQESFEETVQRLSELPFMRTPEEQFALIALIETLMPLADTYEQVIQLESAISADIANLHRALQGGLEAEILNAPLLSWRPGMIPTLEQFSPAFISRVLRRWAAAQSTDSCLREDDALIWFIQGQVSHVSALPEADVSPRAFVKACCQIWLQLPIHYLRIIQTSLPVAMVDNFPTLFYMYIFRLCSNHNDPKSILQYFRDHPTAKCLYKSCQLFT